MKQTISIFTATILTMALTLASCSELDGIDTPNAHVGEALRFTVAPPAGYIDGNIQTRTSIITEGDDKGKVDWTDGDILYANIAFFGDDQIGTDQPFTLTYAKPSADAPGTWSADPEVVWEGGMTSAKVKAHYIGTAKPGTEIKNQEIYLCTGTTTTIGDTINIAISEALTTIFEFKDLKPGDVVTITSGAAKNCTMDATTYKLSRLTTTWAPTATVAATADSTRIVAYLTKPAEAKYTVKRGTANIVTAQPMDLKEGATSADALRGLYYTYVPTTLTPGDMLPGDILATVERERFLAWAELGRKAKNGYNVDFTLAADIDLGGIDWEPLGTNPYGFTGTFDGGGHTISGLKVTGDKEYAGLFGYIWNATIRDLHIEGNIDVSHKENAKAGGILGYAADVCTITGCSFKGTVKGERAGGIAGAISGSGPQNGPNPSTLLTNCYTIAGETPTVITGSIEAGGIVGASHVKSVVTNCYSLATVEGASVGGITGNVDNSSNLYNSFWLMGDGLPTVPNGAKKSYATVSNCKGCPTVDEVIWRWENPFSEYPEPNP